MEREAEFRAWLQARGAQTDAGRNTRVAAVKKIEQQLAALGSPHRTLVEAWEADGFAGLRDRIRAMRRDFQQGGQDFRILMPDSREPSNRLSSWNSYLGQYGQFLAGGPPLPTKDADRIRQYVLEAYIEPAREQGRQTVDVPVSDVHSALGLTAAWPNVCQALSGVKMQELAEVPAPTCIGPELSSTTIFRFELDGTAQGRPTRETSADSRKVESMTSTNLILYGPPGTGKTYATAARAVALCGEPVPDDREELIASYRRLAEAGRIEFVTFHQSMAYEDFVEGLRPVQSGEDGSAGFGLVAQPGIFRRIARRAETSTGTGERHLSIAGRKVFKMSIGEAANPDDAYLFEEAINGGYTLLGFEDIDWSDERYADREAIVEAVRTQGVMEGGEPNAFSGRVQMPFIFRNWMKRGDIIIVSKGNSLFRAIGVVKGDYEFVPRGGGDYGHRRAVDWLWVDPAGVPVSEIYARSFIMKSVYLLTTSDLNIPALERYIASQQHVEQGRQEQFVLIIDEINRANISKVFGELITLLEPDKRLGRPGELKVRLPYSQDEFGVPANLHIIGTMNTADRSIALLDIALRRRFEFQEIMPAPSVLVKAGEQTGIDLPELLTRINARVEYLFDRDHQIGHAYFVNCHTRDDVDAVMRHKLIPLLSEYFYDDWSKVAMVLGDYESHEREIRGGFLNRVVLQPPPGLSEDGDAPLRFRWSVRAEPFDYGRLLSA